MRVVKLRDICQFKYGKGLPEGARRPGAFKVYGSNGYVGTHSEALTDGAAIVIGRKGSVGQLHFSPQPCWPIDTTYYVDVSCTEQDLRWLHHALKSLRLPELNKATGVPGLNRNDAYEKALWLPSLEDQHKLASILDLADSARQKREDSLGLLDMFLGATFLDFFGDPLANPRRFATVSLETLCCVIVDCLHTTPQHCSEPTAYPSIRTSELQNGYIDLSTAKYVSHSEYVKRNLRHTPATSDIIYSREGERFGIAALIPEGMSPCLGQRTMLFRADPAVATPEFLWALLNTKAVYYQAASRVGGATSPHVNIRDIRRFKCIFPPVDLMVQYSQLCQKTFQERTKIQGSIVLARQLQYALAHNFCPEVKRPDLQQISKVSNAIVLD